MASKKKEELLQPEVQTQVQPAAQSTYSAEGLNSRADVEKAMANVSYRPGQQVTDAADALKQWQQNRPADYQSSYQDKINSLLGQLLERENFSTATPVTRFTASTSSCIPRTPTMPARTRRHRLLL